MTKESLLVEFDKQFPGGLESIRGKAEYEVKSFILKAFEAGEAAEQERNEELYKKVIKSVTRAAESMEDYVEKHNI